MMKILYLKHMICLFLTLSCELGLGMTCDWVKSFLAQSHDEAGVLSVIEEVVLGD